MRSALLCLACWHWTLSHKHTSDDEIDKLKEFYCEDCQDMKKIVYKGLVEPVPNITAKG